MDQLKKANEYVKQNHISQEELPAFHVTPPCGWMNDPNGFSVYQGKTHLFYQFHPYSTVWGPMHWGHYETEDFVKWTELPEGDYTSFDICFAQNEKHFTKFTYDRADKTIEIDRTYCGMIRDVLAQRKVPVKVSGDVVKIRMILDKYSAEIFINDGAQVMSTTFYTPLDADQISFVCDGSVTVNIDKYDIFIGEMA